MDNIFIRDIVYSLISGLTIYVITDAISLLYTLTSPIWIVIMQIICCGQLAYFIAKNRKKTIHSLIRILMIIPIVIVLIVICAPLYRVLAQNVLPNETLMQENFGGMLTLFSFLLCFITSGIALVVLLIFDLVSSRQKKK